MQDFAVFTACPRPFSILSMRDAKKDSKTDLEKKSRLRDNENTEKARLRDDENTEKAR